MEVSINRPLAISVHIGNEQNERIAHADLSGSV